MDIAVLLLLSVGKKAPVKLFSLPSMGKGSFGEIPFREGEAKKERKSMGCASAFYFYIE